MPQAILDVVRNIALAFYNAGYALSHPQLWLDWSDRQALMRFVYYGASAEFLHVILTALLVLTAVGLWRNAVLWAVVRGLEGFANAVGRFFAWAGLIMVIQQIVIVFMQRIFVQGDLAFGLGVALDLPVSWYAEELKLYNALVVALCCAWTFVQGGHVRVDLVYAKLGHGAKRIIDMAGALLFMMPVAMLIWVYGWFFLWRHLIVPNPSASDPLDRLLMKARAMRWNVETYGFSPNGFNGYFLFKILLLALAAMIFLQAVAFFYRSFLEWREGPDSAGRHLDTDRARAGHAPAGGAA